MVNGETNPSPYPVLYISSPLYLKSLNEGCPINDTNRKPHASRAWDTHTNPACIPMYLPFLDICLNRHGAPALVGDPGWVIIPTVGMYAWGYRFLIRT